MSTTTPFSKYCETSQPVAAQFAAATLRGDFSGDSNILSDDEEGGSEFKKSEISSFIDEDPNNDLVNGFGPEESFSDKEIDDSSGEDGAEALDDYDSSPLDDSDDDIEIPAFIRKKMGK